MFLNPNNFFQFEFSGYDGAQRTKIAEKVHKPPLGINVINFELNVYNASIWVPWNPSDTKKL